MSPGDGDPEGGGGGDDGDELDKKKESDAGDKKKRRVHRVATILWEEGAVLVVSATMMTPLVPRRAVIRPCLS